jgi:Rrf2 family protein
VRVTARLAYGLGALVDLAAADGPVKGAALADGHGVSVGFLESILADLRRGGIVASKRGADGGYWLARPAAEITVADAIRTLDGAGLLDGAAGGTGGDLAPVWDAIAEAAVTAAESLTLASVARSRARAPT